MQYTPKTIMLGAIAVAGTIVPWYFFFQMSAIEPNFGAVLAKAFANPASTAVAVDICLASVAFWIWLIPEARRLKMRHWWVYIALNFIALSCAAAVFFIMRDLRLRQMES